MHAFADVLRLHAARYPLMAPHDAVKLCYQAEFGGGHLIADRARSLARLRAEAAAAVAPDAPRFEPIGGGLARLHLGGLPALPSLETINGAFACSAAAVLGTREGLESKLRALEAACAGGDMPFDSAALADDLDEYRAQGCPMVSHSRAYRDAYAPAYRVVLARFEALWPALARIDEVISRKGRAIAAIDGRCGSGKSTLGALLRDVYGANLYHMDDFFLRPQQRAPQRYAEPGGNVDRERFLDEVLRPMANGEPFAYRPFDCGRMALADPVSVAPARVEIVEGAYALHPALRDAYDVRIFCDVDPALQRERILARNGGAMLARFEAEWIPMEERYFEAYKVREACDLVLK